MFDLVYNSNMTEESTPEQPQSYTIKPSTRELLGSIKAVNEISPDMSAQEAWDIIKAKNEISKKMLTKAEQRERLKQEEIIKERLKAQGLDNPEEWTFYNTVNLRQERRTEFTEEDMAKLSSNFPQGIEFFVSQGHISVAPKEGRLDNKKFIREIPDEWEVYVRVRPNEELNLPQS